MLGGILGILFCSIVNYISFYDQICGNIFCSTLDYISFYDQICGNIFSILMIGLHIGFLQPFFIFIHDRTEPPLQGAGRYTGQCTFLQNRLLHIVLRPSLRITSSWFAYWFCIHFFIFIHERTVPVCKASDGTFRAYWLLNWNTYIYWRTAWLGR